MLLKSAAFVGASDKAAIRGLTSKITSDRSSYILLLGAIAEGDKATLE